MDKKKSWEQVDEIIKVLKTGCEFLDFPENKQVSNYMAIDDPMRNYADCAD